MALENRQHFVVPLLVSPAKGHLTSNCRYSILMTYHYPDLGGVSDWSCREENLTYHTQGISALVSQTSLCGETSAGIVKCQLFSQAMLSSITVIHWWEGHSQNKTKINKIG